MRQKAQPMKRKRGVLLSDRGWQRLQAAEQRSSNTSGGTKAYTLQELSEVTGLSGNTLARVRGRKTAVDHQTLDTYFQAFGLSLELDDYSNDADTSLHAHRSPIPPSGQLPLNSKYYIQRPPLESMCIDAICQPGGLVRLKGPRLFGKTSLAALTLQKAREQQYVTVILSLRLADSETFSNLNRFLQWFCAVIAQNLGLGQEVEQAWDDLFGASYNCTHFFEAYLLQHLEAPIVLVLDDVDSVFDFPALAADFFGMLRAWHEKSRYGDASSELWQKLRLIMVHAQEVHIPLNISQSPFNAGILIELPYFNLDQAIDLAQAYDLDDPASVSQQLMPLLGGHPHLMHLGMYHLHSSGQPVQALIEQALTGPSIFSTHLSYHLWELQKQPQLLTALQVIIQGDAPVELPSLDLYKLKSRGLVVIDQHQVEMSCDLYQGYFQQMLAHSNPI